jgi:hypothetical protein
VNEPSFVAVIVAYGCVVAPPLAPLIVIVDPACQPLPMITTSVPGRPLLGSMLALGPVLERVTVGLA